MVAGPDPYEHDPNDAWWRPGWTAQNHTFIAPDAEPPPTPFPVDIPMVNIVATYMDDEGNPATGRLLIRPNARYTDTASGATILPRVRSYRIQHGRLDISLPSSDSDALDAPFTYTVREAVIGGRQFAINVPSALSGTGPVKLHTLKMSDAEIIPIDTMPPTYGWQVPTSG
ncbi:hypothetical protein ACFYP4_02560 [Streptomyces sp. NPDC005551]|uniref:hypothetical protein n=1 Tax=Streptomyces sp. NPDC005551 TaxID=3364725 RepID=UPI003685E6D4